MSDIVEAWPKSFSFTLSLRFRHPTMHAGTISGTLNMQPRFQWNVGERRVSPNGTELGGVREETYWSSELNEESSDLIDALDASLSALEIHKDFLREFAATGGEIEYFIGWFTTDISGGDTLGWELLNRLAELRINLALDVYGNKSDSLPATGRTGTAYN